MAWKLRDVAGIFQGADKKSQLLFILDGMIINGAYVLTTGTMISGYAMLLGASDFLTALMNNCVNFATILSIISFIVFENRPRRKKLLLSLNFLSRLLMVLIAPLPLVIRQKSAALAVFVCLVVASEFIFSVYRVGWMVWMMRIAPKEYRNSYVYLRMFFVRIFMSAVSLFSGVVLDALGKGYVGFLIVFMVSFAFSIADLFILNGAQEIPYPADRGAGLRLREFLAPVQAGPYRNFLIFTFLFYLFQTMAASFTPIYMIKYLGLNYKSISMFSVVNQTAIIASGLVWMRIENKKGFSFTMGMSAFFMSLEMMILPLATGAAWPLLFLSHALSGVGIGGFATSTFTYRYDLMPENDRTIYEGWYYFIFGLSMLFAPFLGQAVLDRLPDAAILFQNKLQTLYLLSFALLSLVLFITFALPSVKDGGKGIKRAA